MDGSPQSLQLAHLMTECPDLRVSTSGIDLAIFLSQHTTHSTVLFGGEIDRPSRSIIPGDTLLDRRTFRIGFFGGTSYTAVSGLMEREPAIAHSKRRFVGQCERRFALVRANQFDRFGPYVFLPSQAIHRLIVLPVGKQIQFQMNH